ncbi:MAG: hypothetical protein Q8M31_13820 [Beijerinckiaceae bacterium]|nr:hypothetical protein [Beijerinckiaceae bacterium]
MPLPTYFAGGALMNPVDRPPTKAPNTPIRATHGRKRMTARPAVLRALTDLFCLREDLLDEDVERFRELALQIIPDAGPSTRLYVAAKLARHPMAPRAVLAKLAENDPPCATLLLEHACNFPLEDQLQAALIGDRASAVALANRAQLAAPVSEALIARNDPNVTRVLAENPTAAITNAIVESVKSEARPDRIYAEKLQAKALPASSPSEGFLAASQAERARLIIAARRASLSRATAEMTRDEALMADLLNLSIDRKWPEFISALSHKTALRADIVEMLLNDKNGEPLALLLALVGATQAEAIRIFLCCESTISHSYQRVRDLSLIVAETPGMVAGALLYEITGARSRISTYPGMSERRAEPLAQGVRAADSKPAQTLTKQPTKTKVILRRRLP